MPFTPYHLGPGLLVGLLLLSFIDFPTFLVASVIVDVEPFLVLILRLNYPLHGFFHSFLGGTLVAAPLALAMYHVRNKLSPLMSFFKLEQKVSFKRVLAAALLGVYIHILLDSRGYTDIQPFYPSTVNPFLASGPLAGLDSVIFCIWSFLGAAVIYVVILVLVWRKNRK
jgi:membrane-bound metal-dependent hydrolase YbcI (DUF457 family)